MTNPDHTLLVNIIDRSGSMSTIRSDAEGGFNHFLSDQKKVPGKATVFTAKFDDSYDVEHDHLDLPLVGSFSLEPRGSTALLDALGTTIDTIGERLAQTPEDQRPGKVIVTVVTDGLENASRNYTRQQIFDKITRQRDDYGWEFIFLAANQDAIATGTAMGFAKGSSLTYDPNSAAVAASYSSLSDSVTRTRTTGAAAAFTDDDRAAASTSSP